MPLLIAITILTLIGICLLAVFFYAINYRTIMSVLAGIIFFAVLTIIPPILAGSNEGLQILVFLGILLIVYMSIGKEITRDRRLNFFMGVALLLGIMFNFINFCRR